MPENNHIVADLIGKDGVVVHPYTDVKLEDGLTGEGYVRKDGTIYVYGRPEGKISLNADNSVITGEAEFTSDDDGKTSVTIKTQINYSDWYMQPMHNNKVLNIFRKKG